MKNLNVKDIFFLINTSHRYFFRIASLNILRTADTFEKLVKMGMGLIFSSRKSPHWPTIKVLLENDSGYMWLDSE